MSGEGTKRPHAGELDSEETSGAVSKLQRTLPPAVAKKIPEWQRNMDTVKQRDVYMLKQEMYTDCVFSIFGNDDQPVEVKSHRLILTRSSPVFSSMFFGDMKRDPEEVINLPDVNLEAFHAMLEYIYTGSIDLTSYSYKVVCDLLYVCKKYLLPKTLLDQIYGHLWRNIYPDNMWTAIEFAEDNDEPHLEQVAWEVVELNTLAALNADNFGNISGDKLEHLVNNEHLNCSEEQLFNALLHWAVCKARKSTLQPTPLNLRNILRNVIPKIRLLSMKGVDFVKKIMKSNIFTDLELVIILANFFVPNKTLPIPENLCKLTETRKQKDLDVFFVHGLPDGQCVIKVGDILNINNTNHVYVQARIMLKKRAQIVGIEIPYQIRDEINRGDDTHAYDECMTIVLYDATTKQVLQVKKHKATVIYGTVTEWIKFKNVGAEDKLEFIGVYIVFHKTGWYPAGWRTCADDKIHKSQFKTSLQKVHAKTFRYVRNIVIKKNTCVSCDSDEDLT